MRHQPVAMPFEPVATQCGLPKSPGTESRTLRSRIGVLANDQFHSLIPPAGENRRKPIYTFFSACCAFAGSGSLHRRATSQFIELHSIPASQGRITGYRIGAEQSAGIGTTVPA